MQSVSAAADRVAVAVEHHGAVQRPFLFPILLPAKTKGHEDGFEIGIDEIHHDVLVAGKSLPDDERLALAPLRPGAVGLAAGIDTRADDLENWQPPGGDLR